ncbi:MAG: AI-2E family transporter [Sphingomonadales bacterium]|nr:AI-2E family transporter [Sphingomonadales bacterium]MDE2171794.1 AI-2E family transporter [Sphingomonadales bacterium]
MDKQQVTNSSGFLVFLVAVTLAMALVLAPFAGALLWAALVAILFQPLYQRVLANMPGHRNRAASLTLIIIVVTVILPAAIVATLVLGQASAVYASLIGGQINIPHYFQQAHDGLPQWLQQRLSDWGMSSLDGVQAQISDALNLSFRSVAAKVFAIGTNAAAFMLAFGTSLYVCFFLLRDGERLGPALCAALPMERANADALARRFVSVVRATIKGSMIVGVVQGALGAITFWLVGVPTALLWGLLMGLASLLPAVGTGIVWVPMALYLLAIGEIAHGVIVVVSGLIVIGMADNMLRPILVGRDTGLPDYVVLVTTLGGIATFGLSGIVIGPVVAALFLTAWEIMAEKRRAAAETTAP